MLFGRHAIIQAFEFLIFTEVILPCTFSHDLFTLNVLHSYTLHVQVLNF